MSAEKSKKEISTISGDHKEPKQESEETVEREAWGHKADFLLSCIGYAVGLGNVWRFPYLCYENGGGAFLIPYLCMLVICGFPLIFIEFSFGQFTSSGAMTVWNIAPLFKGVGIGMIVISALVCIYYNIVVAWVIYYIIKSFTFPLLPWITCDNEWNTDFCKDDLHNTTRIYGTGDEAVRATEEFWSYKAHNLTGVFSDFNGMNWPMFACLIVAWITVGACIIKGVQSSGKVVYFTAVFPYIVLVILFFRGVTLPGAIDGIKFYIIPEIDRLLSIDPWKAAATQIFYSIGISFGVLITFSSYNQFRNNCQRDAIILGITNCGTSIFAGFVVFSILGFMAQDSGREVKDVIASGPGLAFIAYPEAVARMPGSQFWSVMFFLMLFFLGLDSEFAMMETVITAVVDEIPPKYKKHKLYFTISLCVVFCICGIPIVTKSGLYLFNVFNSFSAGFSLIVIGIIYLVVITYIYGFNRYSQDIQAMTGFLPNIYWKVSWCVTAPITMFVVLVLSFVYHTPVGYTDYVFPLGAQIFGWLMSFSSFVVIPGYMIYAVIYKSKAPTVWERIQELSKPTPAWGPLLNENRISAGYPPHSKSNLQGQDNPGFSKEMQNV